ncbi:MAG TPA: hypothetical protein VI564_07390 [Candidatus Nanoarchaeia archaeon]|nr:hypothetical protein [Candidatus Nanoarchaeia archaeon]
MKPKIHKKSQTSSGLKMVMGILVGLAVLFFAYHFLFKGSTAASNVIGPSELKIRDKACVNKGNDAMERGIDFTDADKDGRPDACDICIKGTDSANINDKDLDGMPDACDKDSNDDTVFECNGKKTSDNRCT